MNFSFGLSVSGLIYIILVAIVFFKRKKLTQLKRKYIVI